MKLRKALKIFLLSILIMIVALAGFGYWFIGLVTAGPRQDRSSMESTLPEELSYLTKDSVAHRGKILAVVTSTATMGPEGKTTGYEMTELARAYYVFMANGFEVDVASPKGGDSPVVIDDDDVDRYDFAFLNDPVAQSKVSHTLPLSEVVPEAYEAVYFVGGKGAMFDFPNDPFIQKLVAQYHASNKVIGAVCHGPAALVNVRLGDGEYLLEGKNVSSFTNQEELFLIPDAPEIFPFLLENQLGNRGAKFVEAPMYLENVVQDDNLITGQNPWSTWTLAETMVRQLGYEPKNRVKTPEEISVHILKAYEEDGTDQAKELAKQFIASGQPVHRELLAVHGVISVMQGKLGKTFGLIGLLNALKSEG